MGDRASVVFRQGSDLSPVLCSHWGGREFQNEALLYAHDLIQKYKDKRCYPLERLEPDTVMVDFIRYITKDMDEVKSDLYIARDEAEVDDSDNGCQYIDLPVK